MSLAALNLVLRQLEYIPARYAAFLQALVNHDTRAESRLPGWGGLFAVMLMRRVGRLPILFWSQVLALGFMVGCTFAPSLATFTAFRCLTAFFG